jgi:hypothetical protein
MKLRDLHNVIFSLVSASGVPPSGKLNGLIDGLFGRVHVRANLSARQAKALGLLMSGTYGQPSTILSESAALTQLLANRLQAKTALLGSTLYKLTWKERVTPSGQLIPALRASVRRTSDNDSIGWPTPTARDFRVETESNPFNQKRIARKAGLNLSVIALRAHPAQLMDSGEMLAGLHAGMENGQLNPAHSLWLQLGPFATAWLNCAELVTRSTSRKPKAL